MGRRAPWALASASSRPRLPLMGREHSYYLRDLGYWLRERAQAATSEARSRRAKRPGNKRTFEDTFADGRAAAYYEVLSHMHNQAGIFEIPLSDLALEGLDPERDLI